MKPVNINNLKYWAIKRKQTAERDAHIRRWSTLIREEARKTEANLTATLYALLKVQGFDVILEYWHGHSRYDAVIVENNEIVAIIEVKVSSREGKLNRQQEKYMNNDFQVPVYYLRGWDNLKTFVEDLKLHLTA